VLDRIREARRNESGFTLIELLIVIVILGVLAGIVVFAVSGINDTSKNSACKADTKNVEIAAEAFYAQKKAYADSVTSLVNYKLLPEPPDTTEGITTYGTISVATDGTLGTGTVPSGKTAGTVEHTCTF
jgi:prepilin-type N-terminal cleavage/methylation domain-containing protein